MRVCAWKGGGGGVCVWWEGGWEEGGWVCVWGGGGSVASHGGGFTPKSIRSLHLLLHLRGVLCEGGSRRKGKGRVGRYSSLGQTLLIPVADVHVRSLVQGAGRWTRTHDLRHAHVEELDGVSRDGEGVGSARFVLRRLPSAGRVAIAEEHE